MKQFLINIWNAQKNAHNAKYRHEWIMRNIPIMNNRVRALQQIAAQETPSANATVKCMARIAREALK